MKIKNGLLFFDNDTQVQFIKIPSSNYGGILWNHIGTFIHCTEGGNPAGTIAWFSNPASQVSAHLLIARDGTPYQFVPFDRMAYHAGNYLWNLNSIGIEIDNWGIGTGNHSLPVNQVVLAKHWKQTVIRPWEIYYDPQVAMTIQILRALEETYGPMRLIGHEDVIPEKTDPGPAFPWGKVLQETFKDIVYPPAPTVPPEFGQYRVTSLGGLNIRSDPYVPLPGQPSNIIGTLKVNVIITVFDINNGWARIGDSKYVWAAFLEKQ